MKPIEAVQRLRAAVADMLRTTNMSEWKTDVERAALKEMQEALEDTESLELTPAQLAMEDIHEIMWPREDPDKDWSADTLDEIAVIMEMYLAIEPMITPSEEGQVIEQSSHSYAPQTPTEKDANTASTEELEAASDILDKAKDNG